jgi:hypothetical protein
MAKVDRGETVWKIGMGPEIGVPKAAKMCLRAAIGRFLPSTEHTREACGYFPNSFGRVILRSWEGLNPPLVFRLHEHARFLAPLPAGVS